MVIKQHISIGCLSRQLLPGKEEKNEAHLSIIKQAMLESSDGDGVDDNGGDDEDVGGGEALIKPLNVDKEEQNIVSG